MAAQGAALRSHTPPPALYCNVPTLPMVGAMHSSMSRRSSMPTLGLPDLLQQHQQQQQEQQQGQQQLQDRQQQQHD
eukprot:scaffold25441_cov16-Tisochrysis_lutea.AAC.1